MATSAHSAAQRIRTGARRMLTRSGLHQHVSRHQLTTTQTCVRCCSATAAPRQWLFPARTVSEWRDSDRQLSQVRYMQRPGRSRGIATYSDPYATLGLQRGASRAEVDAAYRKLAMQWHPDRNQENKEGAEKRFKVISEAYQSICSGSAKSPFGGSGAGTTGSPGGFSGGFSGGFPGGSHVHIDPQMAAFLREMMKGPQLSEQQIQQMMAEAARRQRNPRHSSGPGFQSVRYEFSFGGRPNAREPTRAEKEAMEVSRVNALTKRLRPNVVLPNLAILALCPATSFHRVLRCHVPQAQMKAVNEELKAAVKTAAKEAAKAAASAVANAAASAAKRSASRFLEKLTSPFRSSEPRKK